MLHKIISTFGLGLLGIDPITAVYMIGMGLRKDKKSKISLFWFSFMIFSILGGAITSVLFGGSAIAFLKKIAPGDNSPIWAILKFSISFLILVFVYQKFFKKEKKKKRNKKTIEGSFFKYLFTGLIFAITCFTDPTYYAMILLAGETNNYISAIILMTIWFLVSQFMAMAVYLANHFNLLKNLIEFWDRLKAKRLKELMYLFYIILVIIAIVLLIDSGYFLFAGKYLF